MSMTILRDIHACLPIFEGIVWGFQQIHDEWVNCCLHVRQNLMWWLVDTPRLRYLPPLEEFHQTLETRMSYELWRETLLVLLNVLHVSGHSIKHRSSKYIIRIEKETF